MLLKRNVEQLLKAQEAERARYLMERTKMRQQSFEVLYFDFPHNYTNI
jgi:hypothetical protein